MIALVALLQATPIGPPVPNAVQAVPSAPCPKAAAGEVVVCGGPKRDDPHRLRPLPGGGRADPQLGFRLPGGATIAPTTAAPGWDRHGHGQDPDGVLIRRGPAAGAAR